MTLSYKKFWPADRIEQAKTIKAKALALGMKMTIENRGLRHCPLFTMRFSKDGAFLRSFFDAREADQWLDGGNARGFGEVTL